MSEQTPVLVSPVSFWELAVLVERGRVSVDRDLTRWCRDLLASGSVQVATLNPFAAISAARLEIIRRCPHCPLITLVKGYLAILFGNLDVHLAPGTGLLLAAERLSGH